MGRVTRRRRRWREQVLLAGVILLTGAGILLLHASRPRAGEPEAEEVRPGAGRRGARPIPLGSGRPWTAPAGVEEQKEGAELVFKLLDAVSGDPIGSRTVSLCRQERCRSAATDEKGRVTLAVSDGEEESAIRVEAEGYNEARLSGAEVLAMLQAGGGVIRLAPLGRLTARLLDSQSNPLEPLQVCCRAQGAEFCGESESDTVEINDIPPGDHVCRAVASSSDGERPSKGDHLAVQTLHFQAGEHRRIDFRSAGRLAQELTVQLRDAEGRPVPVGLLELEIEPRQEPADELEEVRFEAVRSSRQSFLYHVSWHLDRGGWYRLTATPRLGPDKPIAEREIFVGEGDTVAILTVARRPILCRLHDKNGQPLAVRRYSVSFQYPEGTDTFGGTGSGAEIQFFWPAEASSVLVRLFGPAGEIGEQRLESGRDGCSVVVSTPPPAAPS